MLKRKILITGAAGRIGSDLSERFKDRYDLRLMAHLASDGHKLEPYGQVVVADLTDLPSMNRVCEGVDTVIHLAGETRASATWSELLPNNIVGVYNAFVAAKRAKCRRFLFASSIHAVSGYPRDVQVRTDDPVNPGDLYGVSKCFGESLGRYMAEKEGLSTIVIRIGAYQDVSRIRNSHHIGNFDAYVSRGDLAKLIVAAVEKEDIEFAIVHGISDNTYKRLDVSSTRTALSYEPEDDFARENPAFSALEIRRRVRTHSDVVDGGQSGLREELDD